MSDFPGVLEGARSCSFATFLTTEPVVDLSTFPKKDMDRQTWCRIFCNQKCSNAMAGMVYNEILNVVGDRKADMPGLALALLREIKYFVRDNGQPRILPSQKSIQVPGTLTYQLLFNSSKQSPKGNHCASIVEFSVIL